MRTTRRPIAALGFLLSMVLAASGPAQATSFQVLGVGSRSSAMLVGTSAVQGPESIYYNPGALTLVEETEILSGFHFTGLSLEINGHNIDEEEISGTHLGFAHPTTLLGRKVSFGALLYIPTQRLSRFLTLPLDQPQYLYFGTRNQRMIIMAAAAMQVTKWLSLGVGTQILLDAFSEPDFTIIQDPDSENDIFDPVADAMEAQSFGFASVVQAPIMAPIVGIRITPGKRLTLGLSYRGEIRSSIAAPLKVTIEEINIFGMTLAESHFNLPNKGEVFYSPQEVSLGLTWNAGDNWVLGLDVTWFDWSEYPPTFSEGLPEFIGGLAVIILPVPGFLPIKPPTQDVIVPALGAEWHAYEGRNANLWLRGGYSYRPTMVKEDRGLTNYLDSDTHIVGAGVGLTLDRWSRFVPEPLSIDAYVQVHVLEERDILKDDPASSPFGDLRIGGALFGGGIQAVVRF